MFEKVLEIYKSKGLTLAFAESCTGGWLAKAVTDNPGASEVFLGSLVTYANEAKENLLGVPMDVIEEYGAVSYTVARAMAEGVAAALMADVSLAVTGIAGPGGGSAEKPVGTVYMAVCAKGHTSVRLLRIGDGNYSRDKIRRAVLEIAEYRLIMTAEEL